MITCVVNYTIDPTQSGPSIVSRVGESSWSTWWNPLRLLPSVGGCKRQGARVVQLFRASPHIRSTERFDVHPDFVEADSMRDASGMRASLRAVSTTLENWSVATLEK